MVFRVAQAYDCSSQAEEAGFARLAVAAAKYWTNKRCGVLVGEAMECLGGAGYVEESILPRLFREAPLNGIWEGSGNVICLDVLRALTKQPAVSELLISNLELHAGSDPAYDTSLEKLKAQLLVLPKAASYEQQHTARQLTENIALMLQAAELLHGGDACSASSQAFIQTRLQGDHGMAFGTLPFGINSSSIVERVLGEH